MDQLLEQTYEILFRSFRTGRYASLNASIAASGRRNGPVLKSKAGDPHSIVTFWRIPLIADALSELSLSNDVAHARRPRPYLEIEEQVGQRDLACRIGLAPLCNE